MFVFPLLLVLFPALAQYVQARVDNLAGDPRFFDQLVRLTPFLLLWLLLSFAYVLTPNTKVNLLSGILAGLVAAMIFVVVQKLIIALQIGVSKYSPIYGSFLAFPLLLIWLHASWMIMLFGAEFSFAHQNVGTYEYEQDCAGISHSYKILLALHISQLSVKGFHQGEPPLTPQVAAQALHIPIRLVRDIMFELCEAGVLTEIRKDERKDMAYQPARDPAAISVKYVKEALEQRGSANIPVIESAELQQLTECLKDFEKALENSSANVLLRDV
jgi:membrane protein